MPSIRASIEFLARLERYQNEKPYVIILGENQEVDDQIPLSNLEFDLVPSIDVHDMREHAELRFELCAFEYISHHRSAITEFRSSADIVAYTIETKSLLTDRFNAIHVCTYEVKLRQNVPFDRQVYDVNDPLVIEGPAIDVTVDSAESLIKKHLSKEEQQLYLAPNHRYRLRIINTWRPLNPVLEDRPLALCDSRTVERGDLEATDRVLPDRETEIYYLHHAPRQQWYWLENQKSTEPLIFLMYDTMPTKGMARVCPHVSFDNPRKSDNAQPRFSVETRSLVITRVEA